MDIPILDFDHLSVVLKTCAAVFDNNERFMLSDTVISQAISRFKDNSAIEEVLPKVILINSFYSTQIYSTERIADHIISADIDSRLHDGDPSVVGDIRRRHGIKTKKTDKEIDFYSFATKYAALHEPQRYAIFDGLVMRLLTALNAQLGFCPRFAQPDLRDYSRYLSVVDSLADSTGLSSLRYKHLDQGLWIYAKFLYSPVNLSENERHVIRDCHR